MFVITLTDMHMNVVMEVESSKLQNMFKVAKQDMYSIVSGAYVISFSAI